MATSSRILFAGCLALVSGVYGQRSGRLTGRVLADETGKPLAGATVLAAQQIPPAPPVILRAVADVDGIYTIDEAPAGTYAVCVHAGTAYLDPCEWGAPIPSSPGGASQEIRLRLGIPVVVKVDDAAGYAATRDPAKPGSVLAVTLTMALGRERPLPLTNQGDGVYEYSYLAPAETALSVKVASEEFLLADGSGAPIDERGHVFSVVTSSAAAPGPESPRIRLPFTVPRFGPPPVVVLVRVIGKKGA